DDHRRALAQARDLDAAVDGDRRRAGAALGAEEHQRRRRRLGALRRFAAGRRAPDRAVEGLFVRRPGEELVRAGAHRLENQVRLRRARNRENGGARRAAAKPLDRRHRGRGVAAGVDDDEVGRGGVARRAILDHADRNRAGAQQPAHVLREGGVLRNNQTDELCHDLLDQTNDDGKRAVRRGTGAALEDAANRRDPAGDLVAVNFLDEEADEVGDLQRGVAAVLLARLVVDRVVDRDDDDARAGAEGAALDALAALIPVRVGILVDQPVRALL